MVYSCFDPMETRREKFIRLATKRTNDVMERLRILGNLSNKSSYEYYPEDINKIFRAVEDQLKIVKAKFKSGRNKKFQL